MGALHLGTQAMRRRALFTMQNRPHQGATGRALLQVLCIRHQKTKRPISLLDGCPGTQGPGIGHLTHPESPLLSSARKTNPF